MSDFEPSPWAAPGGQPPVPPPRHQPPPSQPPPSQLSQNQLSQNQPPENWPPQHQPWLGRPDQPSQPPSVPMPPHYAVQPVSAGYPYPPQPVQYSAPPPPPPARTRNGPVRFEVVAGTSFGVAYLPVPPTRSGPSVGSLVAGIAAILVSFVVACFGLAGASRGWGLPVSGAFVALGTFIGLGSIGLALFGLRQIRRAQGSVTGRGMAIAGLACGATGLGLTLLAFLLTAVAASGTPA